MLSHTKKIWFCVFGYPFWHKLYGKPKPKPKFIANKSASASQVTVHVPDVDGSGLSPGSQESTGLNGCGLSEGQYQHLL